MAGQLRMLGIGGAATLMILATAGAAPVSTSFVYQGQLKQGGVPVTGTVDFEFSLWTTDEGGSLVAGPISVGGQEVTQGLFHAELDFGIDVFDGDKLWLEIAVGNPTAGGEPTPLSPRQRLSPAPYALHALSAAAGNTLDAIDGSPVNAVFVDAEGDVGIGTTTPGATLDIVAAAGLSLRVNDDLFVDSATGFVGVGRSTRLTTAEAFGLRHMGTGFGGMYIETPDAGGMPFYGYSSSGTVRGFHYIDSAFNWRLWVGGFDRLAVTSAGDLGVGIMVPDNRLHVHKGSAGSVTADGNSVAVFENNANGYLSLLTPDASERGIVFGEASNNVAGGILYNSGATPDGLQFRTNGNVPRMSIDSQGRVGIGTTNPATPLDIVMGAKQMQFRLDGGLVPAINLTGSGGNLGIMRIRNKIEMFPNDAGTTAASMDLRSATGVVNIFFDGGSGNIDANGSIRVDGSGANVGNTGAGVLRFGAGNSGEIIASKRNASGNQFGLDFYTSHANRMVITNSGNVGIGTISPVAKLDVNGRTRTGSLEIVGGADLAEGFEIRSDEGEGHKATGQRGSGSAGQPCDEIAPGTVVVIDPEHPGDLRVSSVAYDAKVAGVVSGAKGLAPGMVLRAEGDPHADGNHLVAMTGRVWCLCEATGGSIRAGDLLTTSATPGHAMRVADESDVPRGAILGKAMTELHEGTGLVLVLVNLQ